jgi:hypothetical protein
MARASPTALTWSHRDEGFKTLPEAGSLQPSIDRRRACNDRTSKRAEPPLLSEGRSWETPRFIARGLQRRSFTLVECLPTRSRIPFRCRVA